MHLLKDENGNVIPHGDGPAHKHEHDHGCEEHACDGCSGGSDKCKNESVALLNYGNVYETGYIRTQYHL